MKREITFKGKPMHLAGRALRTGMAGPEFRAVSSDLEEVSLGDYGRKKKIVTSFLSLDTPVCDLQVKEFNKRAMDLDKETVLIGISNDLPFAQKRFCRANEIANVMTLSDYRYRSFGINYGLLIKELNLLARAVLILDTNNDLRYIQIVEEATNPPAYDDALAALEEVSKKPLIEIARPPAARCVPCEKGTPPMDKEKAREMLAGLGGWAPVDGTKIRKEYGFKDFADAKYFLDLISLIAEEQGHHPTMTIIYNKVKVTLTTHAAGGLTENDFIMARIIDEL